MLTEILAIKSSILILKFCTFPTLYSSYFGSNATQKSADACIQFQLSVLSKIAFCVLLFRKVALLLAKFNGIVPFIMCHFDCGPSKLGPSKTELWAFCVAQTYHHLFTSYQEYLKTKGKNIEPKKIVF